MATQRTSTFSTARSATTLALILVCNSALADGYLILDGQQAGHYKVWNLDARVPGRIYIASFNMLVLDVAGALPSDPGPRVTVHPLTRPSSPIPIVGANGSFYAMNDSQQVVARDATGAVIFTSPAVADGNLVRATELGLQADGKVLIAGMRTNGGPRAVPEEWALMRLNVDGTLDTSFQGGRVLRDPSPHDESASHLAVAPDGKIVVSGYHDAPSDDSTQIGKFFADGTVDFGFGTAGGLVPLEVQTYGGEVQVDSALRVYARAGSRLVTRLLEDGTLDSSYAGVLSGSNFTVSGMLLDSQNRMVLFGRRGLTAWVARLTTSGDPDSTFGDTGTGQIDFTFPRQIYSSGVDGKDCMGSLQPDDKPVIVCALLISGSSSPITADIGLARFNTDGTLDTSFGTVPDADSDPDAFRFDSQTVPYGTAAYVVSNPVTITGINVPNVSIGGDYSIGCTNAYSNAAGIITNGQTVCVRVRASAQPGGVAQTTLSVGGRSATFTVTSSNSPADSIPNAFTFADQTGVAVNTTIESARINVTGLTGFATSTVTGGSQSFNCEANGFTTGTIIVSEGGTICVRHTSATAFSTVVETTLSINGVSDTFSSTTAAAPVTTPPPTTTPPRSRSGGGGALDGLLLALLAWLGVNARWGRQRPRLVA